MTVAIVFTGADILKIESVFAGAIVLTLSSFMDLLLPTMLICCEDFFPKSSRIFKDSNNELRFSKVSISRVKSIV